MCTYIFIYLKGFYCRLYTSTGKGRKFGACYQFISMGNGSWSDDSPVYTGCNTGQLNKCKSLLLLNYILYTKNDRIEEENKSM